MPSAISASLVPWDTEDRGVLVDQQVDTIGGRWRHADHERDGRVRGGDLRDVQTALAVTQHPDPRPIDLRAGCGDTRPLRRRRP